MAPRNNTYESSGPEVKVRGSAAQVLERYLAMARDASAAGDRIAAENYLQHAEHYFRIIAAAQEQLREQYGYQQQLGRSLSSFTSFAVGFSFISITSGASTISMCARDDVAAGNSSERILSSCASITVVWPTSWTV